MLLFFTSLVFAAALYISIRTALAAWYKSSNVDVLDVYLPAISWGLFYFLSHF